MNATKKSVYEFIKLYNLRLTINEISIKTGFHYNTIRNKLISSNVKLRHSSYYSKWKVKKSQIQQIIHLYQKEKRGIQFIALQFNTHWNNIRDILLKNNIKFWEKGILIQSNIKHYGQSKGFSGKKHSNKTKKKMSMSRLGNCNNVTGPKSMFISTIIGIVQGSYELAYLQKLLNDGLTLPFKCGKVKTKYGSYFPDFEYLDRFVEVKSPFTWDVCRGKQPNGKGIKSNIQNKKIKWTNKNIKPVEIIVLDNNEAKKLFLQAIKNKNLITEEIKYKRGKYYKTNSLDLHR